MLPILYLASQSPRRAELLGQMGIPFKRLAVSVDETPLTGRTGNAESVRGYVSRLAQAKARAGFEHSDVVATEAVVLGADTVVEIDNKILGKPANRDHAIEMLQCLSGRTHRVLTAVTVLKGHSAPSVEPTDNKDIADIASTESNGNEQWLSKTVVCESAVTFASLSNTQIAAYWQSGEPADKAGAYGIQGLGGMFVRHLVGSYSAVVGLPLYESSELLRWAGCTIDFYQQKSQ